MEPSKLIKLYINILSVNVSRILKFIKNINLMEGNNKLFQYSYINIVKIITKLNS